MPRSVHYSHYCAVKGSRKGNWHKKQLAWEKLEESTKKKGVIPLMYSVKTPALLQRGCKIIKCILKRTLQKFKELSILLKMFLNLFCNFSLSLSKASKTHANVIHKVIYPHQLKCLEHIFRFPYMDYILCSQCSAAFFKTYAKKQQSKAGDSYSWQNEYWENFSIEQKCV